MGGLGSGRTEGWGGPVVEDARSLDVDHLVREGVLKPNYLASGRWSWTRIATGEREASIGFVVETGADAGTLRLRYSVTPYGGAPRSLDYQVALVTTRPHFGGLRWWFLCPTSKSRVRKLYLHASCDYFLSRQALGLTYTSCREDEMYRALRRAQTIAIRLGGSGSLDELEWAPKPNGMHWRTYQRLRHKALEASAESWLEARKRFGWLRDDPLEHVRHAQ